MLTDRTGQMVQHYEYATFGSTTFQDNMSAYQVSNRYTGQIADDETGLYYYHARYYDPQLGRFIQPDTAVPSATAPQTLNRYSYCDNNPLNLTDPSGHSSFFSTLFKSLGKMFSDPLTWVGVLIGAVVGGPWGALIGFGIMTAANIITTTMAYYAGAEAGMITGAVLAIGLAVYGICQGISMLGMIGTAKHVEGIATVVSSVLAIGSSSASLAGENNLAKNLGYASLGAAAVGALAHAYVPPEGHATINQYLEKNGSMNEKLQYALDVDYPNVNRSMAYTASPITNPVLDVLGKIWALPLSTAAFAYGVVNLAFGANWTIQYNSISFVNVLGKVDNAFTLGNVTLFAGSSTSTPNSQEFGAYDDSLVQGGPHEEGHTWEAERAGVFLVPLYLTAGPFGDIRNPWEAAANVGARAYYSR